MFALLFIYRLVRERRALEVFELAERLRLASLTVLSGLLGFAWLIVAAITTGRFDAYLKTEVAWRAGYTGSTELQPFTGWFISGAFHFGQGIGQLLVFGLIALAAWAINTDSVKQLGVELRYWSVAYIIYLLAVFFPQSSTPRILFGAFPLIAAVAIASEKQPRAVKAGLLVLSILSQVVWLLVCWKYTAPDYTPP
jgi:uncharacterized membrane protein (GlpM family)